jgi:hypothetical protein
MSAPTSTLSEYLNVAPVPTLEPDTSTGILPPIVDACDLLDRAMPEPPELVQGLFREGEKAVIGGQSKSMKSWAAIDCGISVAHGVQFWNRNTSKGRVLIVNLELPGWNLRKRIRQISTAKGIRDLERDQLLTWTLRGHRVSAEVLRDQLRRFADERLALVVVDPLYKLTAGMDENSAGEMASVLMTLEGITHDTGAALLIPAHFANGAPGAKQSIDRICGSGVFARDPDALLTLTALENPDTFTLEANLRTLPPLVPVGLRWEHPVFQVDQTLDTANFRQMGKPGRKRRFDVSDIVALVPPTGLKVPEWQKQAEQAVGVKSSRFYDFVKVAKNTGEISIDRDGIATRDPHHRKGRTCPD